MNMVSSKADATKKTGVKRTPDPHGTHAAAIGSGHSTQLKQFVIAIINDMRKERHSHDTGRP